ncbi:MAG: FtsX-like permease family protein, partial [Acidobacteriota bacterium]
VGSLVGIGSAAIVHPFLDSLLDRHVGPFEVMPGDVVLGIVLGIVAAIFAAYLPARAAAALPPREALGKRRPAAHPSRRWLVIGLLLAALGVAILVVSQRVSTPIAAVALLLGPVLGLIGFGACSPWLLGWLAKRAARLPLAWRLAVRDAGRFRARDGAVVTAVLAGMSMSVTIAALVTSVDHKVGPFPSSYRDDQMLVEGPGADDVAPKIAEELSAIAVAPLQAAYLRGEPVRGRVGGEFRLGLGEWVAVGDAELLRALGADRVGTTHDRSRLVVLDIEDLANVGAETTTVELTTWVGGDIIDTPDITFVRTSQFVREPLYFVDRAALETLGWRASAPPNRTLVPWVVRLDRAVTSKHLSQAREIAAASVRTSVDANLLHLNPTRGAYLSVLLLSVVTGLVVVLIATSLSAAESSGDARILRTVGAAPRLLRLHLAARAAYLSLLGCLLAVPAGLVVAIGIFASADIPLDFIMPWSHLLTIVGVLPVLVYVATWCLQPPKTELRPRLAS